MYCSNVLGNPTDKSPQIKTPLSVAKIFGFIFPFKNALDFIFGR